MKCYKLVAIAQTRRLFLAATVGLGWLGAPCAAPPPIVIQPAGDDNQPLTQPGVFGFIIGGGALGAGSNIMLASKGEHVRK